MGNIRAYSLGIVTENQNNAKKAEALAALLVDYLPNIYNFHLKKYDKFPNSYRIELEGKFIKWEHHIHEAIQISDSICSGWIVMYDRDMECIELIFNKTDTTTFEHNEFNVIRWAHFQTL
jgi:hypothetical protein